MVDICPELVGPKKIELRSPDPEADDIPMCYYASPISYCLFGAIIINKFILKITPRFQSNFCIMGVITN